MIVAPRNALPVGTRIEEYRLLRVLGAGGFGITYLAEDENLRRPVAIKEYLPAHLAVRDADASVHPRSESDRETYAWGLARFHDEAFMLMRFDHRNVVRAMRYLARHNTAYLVMNYEEGESLREVLQRRGTLPEEEVRALVEPVLDGLATVHRAGVLHRDIKPGNIYVRRDGSPVLLDFGAARQAIGERSRSLTAVLTAPYAPIEQYGKGQAQGPWTDVYALGVVAYEALSGTLPPDAPDRIIDDGLVPLSRVARHACSPEVLAAIHAALAVKAIDRPQTVDAWRRILWPSRPPVDEPSADRPPGMRRLTSPIRFLRNLSRTSRRQLAGLALGVAVLALGGSVFWAEIQRFFTPTTPRRAEVRTPTPPAFQPPIVIPHIPQFPELPTITLPKIEPLPTIDFPSLSEGAFGTKPLPSWPPSGMPRAPGGPASAPSAPATSVDASQMPAWYLAMIDRKVGDAWQRPETGGAGRETVVVFDIHRDGALTGLAVEKASGDTGFDRSALDAVLKAAPFAPLPDSFVEPPLRVHLRFGSPAVGMPR